MLIISTIYYYLQYYDQNCISLFFVITINDNNKDIFIIINIIINTALLCSVIS